MDVYHKVLVKLYEVTQGKENQTVDFKDLVRNAGFFSNYNDIFEMLSSQGWISESKKPDYVGITHWGVSEAKKAAGGVTDASQTLKKEANRLSNQVKELTGLIEEFSVDNSKEKFEKVGKIFDEMTTTIARLKNTVH